MKKKRVKCKAKKKRVKKVKCQSILVKICQMIKGKVVCKEKKVKVCTKCNKK